jgi:hypothetical protein
MRRASPNPPKRISDEELESMRPHQIDEELARRVEWAERIEREDDPGKGLPAPKAATARARHLNRLGAAVGEVDRLRSALPPEPDDRGASTRKRARTLYRRAIENAPRSEEEREGMRELREGMAEQKHARETKSKLHKLSDRRRHPRDPKATSVLAAVVSSDFLKDALERKLRSGIRVLEDGVVRELADDQYMTARVFEAQDVAVIYLAAISIEEGGLFAAGEPADRGLMSLGNVANSLWRLSHNGLLTVKQEGERKWRVGWGERARTIAEKAGVQNLPTAPKVEAEEVLTRS